MDIDIDIRNHGYPMTSQKKIDPGELMRCLRTAYRRDEPFQNIDSELNKTSDDEWQRLFQARSPDLAWQKYVECVQA
eukprot:2650718-Pyramimonas_sp.AAC.1